MPVERRCSFKSCKKKGLKEVDLIFDTQYYCLEHFKQVSITGGKHDSQIPK